MQADLDQIKRTIRDQAIKLSLHAYEEAFAERISVDEIREALLNGTIVEDYATHKRGPCCLVHGQTDTGRDLHLVITSSLSPVLASRSMNRKRHSGLRPLCGVREVNNEQVYTL